jgi:hypothetical protein
MTCFDFFWCNWRACYLLYFLHKFSSAFGVWQAFCFWNALEYFWIFLWYPMSTRHVSYGKKINQIFLLRQANGRTCVDFGCTHPINGLFWSLHIYLLGFFSTHECWVANLIMLLYHFIFLILTFPFVSWGFISL